jgi:hypothetical protein
MARSSAMANPRKGHSSRLVSLSELLAMEREMNSVVPIGGV